MTHAEKALKYFGSNFNCSQGVFTAFATEHGMDEKTALRLATCFGGGARNGEMCGAVSGALMVLGLLYGHCDSNDLECKRKAYEITKDFIKRFKEKNGSVVCRKLLGYDISKEDDMKIIQEKNLFRTFCPGMIKSAVDILDEMISLYCKK